jgi:sRNA-binding protein
MAKRISNPEGARNKAKDGALEVRPVSVGLTADEREFLKELPESKSFHVRQALRMYQTWWYETGRYEHDERLIESQF